MIRNILALIGLAFVLFVVVGFAMKWYTFSRQEGKLTVHIFTDKVEDGLQKIKDGAVELKDNLTKAMTKPEDGNTSKKESGLDYLFGPAQKPQSQPQQPIGKGIFNSLPPASLAMPRE